MKVNKIDRYKRSSIKSYDKWHNYDNNIWHRIFKSDKWTKEILAEIDNMSDSCILDAGCGTGRVLESLADHQPRRLCGMDISGTMIEIATVKQSIEKSNIELKTGDLESEIPWDDASFDYVLLTGVFHHLFDPDNALKQIRRVLRPHGKLIIIEIRFPAPLRQLINAFLRLTPVKGDCRFYSPAGLNRILDQAGFIDINNRPVGFAGYLVSAINTPGGSDQ